MINNDEAFAKTAVANWKLALSRLEQVTSKLTDEQLQTQVAPGRNRIYYLLGHLAAVHDRLFPMLGLGNRLHPELDEQFLDNPDRKIADTISPADLRKIFSELNNKLTAGIEALPAGDWLKKHSTVSDEDFAKEPLRNRLAVLLSRTGHIMFHGGQIRLTQ